MTTEIIQMNRITLRCKSDNGLLIAQHGIISNGNAVAWYKCPKCSRNVKIETSYDPKLDCMILVSHKEV
jgi:transposase-like protein